MIYLEKLSINLEKSLHLLVIKESNYRIGRTFTDFVKFIEDNPNIPVVEMDTVHGTRSGKVLLTFIFRNCSLMLAFIIDSCTEVAVKEVIDKLYEIVRT